MIGLDANCSGHWADQTKGHIIGASSLAEVIHRQPMELHDGFDLLDHPLTLGIHFSLRTVFGFQEEVSQAAHEFLIPLVSHGLTWSSARLLDPAAVTWLLMIHVYMGFTAGPGVS
jgi:hypothetical protein